MEILILGDTHIPTRAENFPMWVEKLVERGWDTILHTGDVEEGWVLEYLSHFGKLHAVRGNMDSLKLPDQVVIKAWIGRIFLIHGHQVRPRGNRDALFKLATEKRANVVVSGHTHTPFLERRGSVLLLNPGTATGAWGGSYGGGRSSVIVIKDRKVTLWIEGRPYSRLYL